MLLPRVQQTSKARWQSCIAAFAGQGLQGRFDVFAISKARFRATINCLQEPVHALQTAFAEAAEAAVPHGLAPYLYNRAPPVPVRIVCYTQNSRRLWLVPLVATDPLFR